MVPQPGESARQTLERFVYAVDQLHARRILREDDLRATLNLSGKRGSALSMNYHEPDEENLRSFLLDLRKFVSEREAVFLNFIFNLARRHVTTDWIAQQLDEARTGWKRAMQAGDVKFVVDEEHITPELVLDLWINGYYFHNDHEKARRLEVLARVPISRWLFLNAVVDATKHILFVGHLLKIALREGLVSEVAVR